MRKRIVKTGLLVALRIFRDIIECPHQAVHVVECHQPYQGENSAELQNHADVNMHSHNRKEEKRENKELKSG